MILGEPMKTKIRKEIFEGVSFFDSLSSNPQIRYPAVTQCHLSLAKSSDDLLRPKPLPANLHACLRPTTLK